MKIEVQGKSLKQITKLDLSGKNLKKFPEEIFQCRNLTKLILSNNSIGVVPQEIKSLRKLKVLDLSNNKIKQLHADLIKLPKLETLNVSNNQIKSLPTQLEDSSIKTLLVQKNVIASINESLIKNLEKLNISHNNINIFKISSAVVNLKSLWISDNPIKEFVITAERAPNLKHLFAFTENAFDVSKPYKTLTHIKGNCINQLFNVQKIISDNDVDLPKQKNEIEKMDNKKLNIFISYAHEDDKKWIDLLKKHLKVLNRLNDKIDYWDDTRIHTGDKWKEEIEKSLDKSAVAILLVSTSFLASDFIQNKELPKLLKKAETDGTKIFSVILEPCLFDAYNDINQFQAANDPNKPLCDDTVGDQNRVFVNLMRDILSVLK